MWRGSKPNNSAIVVGITLTNLVIIRLNQMLTFIPNRPSIIDWPANVPIIDEEIPDESSVTKKTNPEMLPNKGTKVLYASDMEDIGKPWEKKAAAAIIIIAALTIPAINKITTFSTRCNLRICLFFSIVIFVSFTLFFVQFLNF